MFTPLVAVANTLSKNSLKSSVGAELALTALIDGVTIAVEDETGGAGGAVRMMIPGMPWRCATPGIAAPRHSLK